MSFRSHDDYFAAQPAEIRTRLQQIQKEVEEQVPGAVRAISYNMPAFKITNTFLYFAAFKNHIGLYPPVTDDRELIEKTKALRGPKGNLSFTHGSELPISLIGRIAKALALQYSTTPDSKIPSRRD
jgi:uncharacterized protein YdhG (YjbR/CyaY superfamily)